MVVRPIERMTRKNRFPETHTGKQPRKKAAAKNSREKQQPGKNMSYEWPKSVKKSVKLSSGS